MEMLTHYMHEPKNWTALAFVFFLVLFVKKAVPPITRALDTRSDKIKDELSEALRLREEAQAVLAEYQKRQREVEKEATEILSHARNEADAMKKQADADLKDALKRRVELANAKIARAEQDAVKEVKENIVDVAVQAARTLIEEDMDKDADDELIQFAIDDIQRIVH